MKIITLMLSSLLFLGINLSAQLLNQPESVEYDPYNNRYLVSNWGNGNIIQIDSTGTQSVWLNNAHCYAGLHRQDSILYVACREYGIKGFDLITGENVLNVSIPGATNINDIVADNSGNLYASSPTGNIIYKLNIESEVLTELVTTGLDTPNGMYYDEPNNRVLFVSFRINSPIESINLADSTVSLITYPGLHNLDGITQDNEGNFYVSSWQNNRVYRLDNTFLENPEIFSNHPDDPADIFFDKINNVLAVPLFFTHQVEFISVPVTSSLMVDIPEPDEMVRLINYPNPFNPCTTISFDLTNRLHSDNADYSRQAEDTELVIYNLQG